MGKSVFVMQIPGFSNKHNIKRFLEKAYCLSKLPIGKGVCIHICNTIHYSESLVLRVDLRINLFLVCTGGKFDPDQIFLALYILKSEE